VRALTVAYVTNAQVRGGAEEHVLTLLRGLDRERFRPLLVCTPEAAARLEDDVPADVETVRLGLRRPRDVGPALRLWRLLRARRVDVLHAHQFYSSLFAAPVARLARVPVVVETPHVREQWRQGWLKSRYVVDRLAGRFVDHYIAVSEANARYLIDEKRLPRAKVTVIANGCDVDRFDPTRRPPPGLRGSLGFGADDPVLLAIGRLEAQKGHAVLLDALAIVRRRFPGVRLVCLGEGSLHGALEAQAEAAGLQSAVRFVGFRAPVDDWLALADLTVLSSFYEGLPLAAIESLAAGRAVVATAVDGTPEVVVHERTGLTVPPGDPVRLAEALCRALADAPWRQALGRAGRAWVRERFRQDRQVRQTEQFYLRAWRLAHARPPEAAEGALGARRP
jgi:glycosyltransferase involved in cell wall biosynthesis